MAEEEKKEDEKTQESAPAPAAEGDAVPEAAESAKPRRKKRKKKRRKKKRRLTGPAGPTLRERFQKAKAALREQIGMILSSASSPDRASRIAANLFFVSLAGGLISLGVGVNLFMDRLKTQRALEEKMAEVAEVDEHHTSAPSDQEKIYLKMKPFRI